MTATMPPRGAVDHADASGGISSDGLVLTAQERAHLGVKARRANAEARRTKTAELPGVDAWFLPTELERVR